MPFGGAKGAGSGAAQHMVMVFRKGGAAKAEWGGGFSTVVEDGLGGPLAIDEFEHGKFTAVGEVFVGIRGGFPGYCVGDRCGPAMAF